MSGEVADIAASMTGSGQYGVWGMAAAAVVGGFVFLRQYLSKGAADRADDDSRTLGQKLLRELLDAERAARLQAELRGDAFAKERNAAVDAMGMMKGQMEVMGEQLKAATRQLEAATSQLAEATEEIARLRRVIEINGAGKT